MSRRRFPLNHPAKILLFVGASREDSHTVTRIFRDSHWELDFVPTCEEAIGFIGRKAASVVISECNLPDGTWKDVLDGLTRSPNPPLLIVAAHAADDRLWAEVLNLGGCDVLAKPFEAKEVVWSVSSAWNEWETRVLDRLSAQPQPAPA